ncbi:MAG: low molecular weight phosphotyrosine protein phosphatase [Alphaproteobacteria bacterium]
MIRVLFVCTGNICRSPTAEGVFRDLVMRAGLDAVVEIDSAGIGAWHVGEPPDPRAIAAARRRAIDLSRQRARQITRGDFDRFDLILAMDRGHLRELMALCPRGRDERVKLFLGFAPGGGSRDVPDPYYGGPRDFETVLDLVTEGAHGLLDHIRRQLADRTT